jgi:tRNA (guanine37-N1)-methyltransferase
MWRATVLTIFPEMFPGPLGISLAGKALGSGLWALDAVDIRDHATDKHRTVDDTPFGGGPGMVMRPDVVDAALDHATRDGLKPAIYLTPRGRVLTQDLVKSLADGPGVVLMEVSLGDFVLSGGEPAAIALIDSVVRLLPGIMGAEETLAEESFEAGLLEYPHYTRPADWCGRSVPDVLMSGHHEKIRAWRKLQAEETTKSRRPDLWAVYQQKAPKVGAGKN